MIKSSKYINACTCIKDYTNKLKYEYLFLQEADPILIRKSLFNFEDNFKRHFKSNFGYPKYKSKYSKNSYTAAFYDSYKCKKNCNIELDLKRRIIKFPKLGNLKIRGYRNIKSINCRLINTTISREKNNKYYVSVLYELSEAPKILPSTSVGLDIVVKKLITMSDGITYDNNEYINKYEERIKREQYKLSKKKKGSKNYYKNKGRLNVLYIKLANARKFYTHKITKYITDNYDIICTESLNTKQMVMNKKCIYQKIFVMQYLNIKTIRVQIERKGQLFL